MAKEPAADNACLRTLCNHRSVRRYQQRPLPSHLVSVLIKAAQSAPTSCNYQGYSIIHVEDEEQKRTLAGLCGNAFLGQAPLVLVFCADIHRLQQVCQQQGYSYRSEYLDQFVQATVDAALACQNASLAAESMGLGTCMVGAIRDAAPEVTELLQLPEGVFALVALTVGYPAEEPQRKPRLPTEVILHSNVYRKEIPHSALATYDRDMASSGAYCGREVPPPEDREAKEPSPPYGWCEHTARRLATANPKRARLGQLVIDQGFSLD